MPAQLLRGLLVGAAVAASILAVAADEKLTLKVSRAVINTRESVVVTAIVPQDPGNRLVAIQADSGEYFRSTEVEIDGAHAPRVFELPLRGLPSGDYVVVAVLTNDKGERTTARHSFHVVSYGDDR